jgi:hypothetical protein
VEVELEHTRKLFGGITGRTKKVVPEGGTTPGARRDAGGN